jgi:hypothetical protein
MDSQDIQLLIEMLGKLDDNQAKAGADRKVWREQMDAETEANRRETVVIRAETKARREEMAAMRDKRVNENHEETMACQEMEARQEEKGPTSVETKPEAAQKEEVPVEAAEVMPVGEPKKKRRRDRKLAAERHRQKVKNSI